MRHLRFALPLLTVVLSSMLGQAADPAPTKAKPVLPFIRDDYPRALAEARARKLPIFIEAWAPW
jgi:hypothetical protein